MAVPSTPVRNETRGLVLASLDFVCTPSSNTVPVARATHRSENAEVGQGGVARVESVIPLATRLNLGAIDIVGGHPTDNLLGVVQVGSVVPLLGSHDKGESRVEVGVRCRTRATFATDAPVHTGAVTAIGLPGPINLVEHFLGAIATIVHIHGNQHTIGDCFGHGRAGAFGSKNIALTCIVPGVFPLVIVVLDHGHIGIFNDVAMRMLHVLGEGVLRSGHRGDRSEGYRRCQNCKCFFHSVTF